MHEMEKRGDITKDQLKGAYAWFAYGTISKLKIRKKVNERFGEQRPHALGGTMALGWLIKERVITIKEQFDVDFDKIGPSLKKLRLKLLEFSFKGRPEDYIQFVKDCANQIPDKAEEKIINVHARRPILSPMNWGVFRSVDFPVCTK